MRPSLRWFQLPGSAAASPGARRIRPPAPVALLGWLAMAALSAGCVHYYPSYGGEQQEASVADAAAYAVSRDLGPMWRMAGESVQGRPLRTTSVGRGPRRVLWIGGIHGNEPEGRVATEQLPLALAAMPDALDQVTLTILEDANPDGRALGIRTNANGVDLNRNFPAANFKPHRMFGVSPLSQPEARVLHDLIADLQPNLVIVAHSWGGDHFINYDGPGAHLAERFSRLSSYPVRDSREISPTPGSLGSWVGYTLGIPILTLEYLRGREPVEAWHETREAILAVILDT